MTRKGAGQSAPAGAGPAGRSRRWTWSLHVFERRFWIGDDPASGLTDQRRRRSSGRGGPRGRPTGPQGRAERPRTREGPVISLLTPHGLRGGADTGHRAREGRALGASSRTRRNVLPASGSRGENLTVRLPSQGTVPPKHTSES